MAAGETYTQQQEREGLEPRHDDAFERNWVPPERSDIVPTLEAWARTHTDEHSRKMLFDAATRIRNLEWLVGYKQRRLDIEEKNVQRLVEILRNSESRG